MNKYENQDKVVKNMTNVFKKSKIAVIGIGGIGTYVSEQLVRMGIGKILLLDNDKVELSNLTRQTLYDLENYLDNDYKVFAAQQKLALMNQDSKIIAINEKLNEMNINKLLDYDLIIDCTDNLESRYILNDFSIKNNKRWIYSSAIGSIGTYINFIPGETPCFECLFGKISEDVNNFSCERNGILTPLLLELSSKIVIQVVKILNDLDYSRNEVRFNILNGEKTELNISSLKCDCKPFENDKKQIKNKYYLICSGDTIQVNFDTNMELINRKLVSKGALIKKKRENISTLFLNNLMINVFSNGKAVFHTNNKNLIEKLIN